MKHLVKFSDVDNANECGNLGLYSAHVDFVNGKKIVNFKRKKRRKKFYALFDNDGAMCFPAKNEILYTSISGTVVNPNPYISGSTAETPSIISNTYENGVGKIVFDRNITEIWDGAFSAQTTITHMMIPNTVERIGHSAFRRCKIESFEMPENIKIIDDWAFRQCSSLRHTYLPDTIESIGEYAFANCTALEEFNFPSGITKINNYTLSTCRNIKEIEIPNSVTEIGNRAFASMGISELQIPSSVTKIGNGLCYGCSSLTYVTIPESVSDIDTDYMFYNCKNLTGCSFPHELTDIGNYMFALDGKINISDCIRYAVNIGNYAFSGCPSQEITMQDVTKSIGDYSFYNPSGQTIKHLSSSLENIGTHSLTRSTFMEPHLYIQNNCTVGDYAFYAISGSTAITIGEYVHAGIWAFRGLKDTKEITVGMGSTFGDFAFSYCNNLERFNDGGVYAIGRDGFNQCFKLKNVVTSHYMKRIEEWTYFYCSGITGTITIPEGVEFVGDGAFSNIYLVHNLVLPSTLASVIGKSFIIQNLSAINISSANTVYDCRNNCNAIIETASNKLVRACNGTTIPDSIVEIGDYAYSYASSVRTIDVPSSVKKVGAHAFSNLPLLNLVNFTEGLEELGDYAFDSDSNLWTITVPSTLKKVGDRAFNANCGWVKFLGSTPPELNNNRSPFRSDWNKPIYVPIEAVETYKTAWSDIIDTDLIEGR